MALSDEDRARALADFPTFVHIVLGMPKPLVMTEAQKAMLRAFEQVHDVRALFLKPRKSWNLGPPSVDEWPLDRGCDE